MEQPTIPGPDPHPRSPHLEVPRGACDAHCHVFGPADRFPYAGCRNYTPPDAPLEYYQNLMQVLGLERAVVVQPSVYGDDHACTEDAIRRLDGRARGVAVVKPEVDEAELDRLNAAGFRGLRFNLLHTGGSTAIEGLETLAAKAAQLGWHVQVYMRGTMLPDLKPRLQRLPTDLVVDHLGHFDPEQGVEQPGFRALLELLERGRCWVKLCPYRFDYTGPPFPRARTFARRLNELAPERLVWGTDWPHPDISGTTPNAGNWMPNDGDLIDALGIWFEDATTIERILVSNPETLYGFGS